MSLDLSWRQIVAGAVVVGSSVLGLTQPWRATVVGDDGGSQEGENNQMGEGNVGDDLVHREPGDDSIEGHQAGEDVVGDDRIGDQIGRDSVDGGQVGGDLIGDDHVGDDQVSGDQIADDQPGRDSVDGDQVGGDQVGRDAVDGDQISDDLIGRDQVGRDSVAGDVDHSTNRTATDNSRTDDHSRDNNSRDNNGDGQLATDNATINNHLPLTWGKATFLASWSADGQETFGPSVVLELDVTLPTNGNDLFLACEFISRSGEPHLWFAKQQIVAEGRQTLTVHFGGPHVNADPSVIGTTRRCHVVSADASASRSLLHLMDMNQQGIEVDPSTGRWFNESRRSLPYGSGVVSTNDVLITIEHL